MPQKRPLVPIHRMGIVHEYDSPLVMCSICAKVDYESQMAKQKKGSWRCPRCWDEPDVVRVTRR